LTQRSIAERFEAETVSDLHARFGTLRMAE
jgi:hypothetical protein